MWKRLRSIKLSSAGVERAAAGAITGSVAVLAAAGVWVFTRQPRRSADRSVWSELLDDRLTLGLVRLLIAATALYALISIGALISRRRWVRAISVSGIEVDAASTSDESLAVTERALRQALAERDEARLLAGMLRDG